MVTFVETPRLLVRGLEHTDLDVFTALNQDPDVYRWMGDGEPLSREEVAGWIDVCHDKYAQRGYGTSAVVLRATGAMVGFAGVVRPPDQGFDEVIYAFLPAVWGQGLARELVPPLCAQAFAAAPGLEAVRATIHPQNASSVRVVERCGFRFLGSLQDPGEDRPTLHYVLDRPGDAGA